MYRTQVGHKRDPTSMQPDQSTRSSKRTTVLSSLPLRFGHLAATTLNRSPTAYPQPCPTRSTARRGYNTAETSTRRALLRRSIVHHSKSSTTDSMEVLGGSKYPQWSILYRRRTRVVADNHRLHLMILHGTVIELIRDLAADNTVY